MDAKTFEISASKSVEVGYGYYTCIKCTSRSQSIWIDKYTIAQSGIGCDNTLSPNKVILPDQVLTKDTTSDDPWQLVGEGYSSFVTVKESKKEQCPILECLLYEEGCEVPFRRVKNIEIGSHPLW